MAKEIERKFLVRDDSYRALAKQTRSIVQGYLSCRPDSTVRVRIVDDEAYLTVKSKNYGCLRGEWEYQIPIDDAKELLNLCEPESVIIEKTRYIIEVEDLKWEIDEFHGGLNGLVVAEIELPSEDTSFELPSFIGQEVTGDPKYYNSNLSKLSHE